MLLWTIWSGNESALPPQKLCKVQVIQTIREETNPKLGSFITDMMKLSKATVAHAQTEALSQASYPRDTYCLWACGHNKCFHLNLNERFSAEDSWSGSDSAVYLIEPVLKGWPLIQEEWMWCQKREVVEEGWCTAVNAVGPKFRTCELHRSREADVNAALCSVGSGCFPYSLFSLCVGLYVW